KPCTWPTLSWSSCGMISATMCGPGRSVSRGGGTYCGSFGIGGGSVLRSCVMAVFSSLRLRLLCTLRGLNRFPQLRRCVRHIDMVDAQGRQRVHHGVSDCGGRAVAAGFADTLDAERMEGIRRHGLAENQRRHKAGARYGVIHQRGGQRLAVIAEDHLLVERFAKSLCHPTVYLAFDNQRVEDHAAIIDQHELCKCGLPCVAINMHQRHMRAKAPGF